MRLVTLNTILNTAPVLIQGAARLIKLIRGQGDEGDENRFEAVPDTMAGIRSEVERLHQRLDADNESSVEQVQLIEALARQQESLATQLRTTVTWLNRVVIISVFAVVVSLIAIYLALDA